MKTGKPDSNIEQAVENSHRKSINSGNAQSGLKSSGCDSSNVSAAATPCCGQASAVKKAQAYGNDIPWQTGLINTPIGEVPRAAIMLDLNDRLGSWKARWGISRMSFRVKPGLYAVGKPSPESLVFVSANYKMSFDRLRSQLGGRDCWIMVLDTKGINVWCAAGKGTFGTAEIVRRIEATRLREIVSHKKLILPQLGAPGVSAHEVGNQTGFKVIYGPVRAEDLPAFLEASMKASPEMRRIRFNLSDRVILIPVELVMSAKYAVLIMVCFFFLSGLGDGIYSISKAATVGVKSIILFLGAYTAGSVATPALLPWLPGRAFSIKGALAGLVFILAVGIYELLRPGLLENWLSAIGWLLIIPAAASFIAMNFTGASTYTSLSGVKREMRIAMPIQIASAAAGLGLWLTGRFV